ncbi:hypothetical protein CPB86DRAFT_780819 [Serendipita vermifera]|nr:hypothetical protein CPB86DRAFT_780819 [Serendipita vermifera]
MNRSLWPIFYSILLFICSAQAAVHRVSHDDSSIQYIPSVCNLSCNRVCRNEWWVSCLSDGSASHRTKGNKTEASFSFKGSSVTLYTRTAPDGGKAIIYIDEGDPQAMDTYSPVTNEANPRYTKGGLDPTKTHKISVVYDVHAFTNDVERFVDVRYFDYDDGVGNGSSNNQGSSSAPLDSQRTSSTATSTPSGTNTVSGSLTASNSARTSPSQTLSDVGPVGASFSTDGAQSSNGVDSNSAAIGSSPGSKIVLSKASVAGIVLGSIALAAVIFLCLFLFFRRRMRTRRDGFHSNFGTPHGFASLVNKERPRDQDLNTARTSRTPSVIRSPFEETQTDHPTTFHDSTSSLQLHNLSHQRGKRQDTVHTPSFRNPTNHGDQRVIRQNQEESFTVVTDDVSESVMSPTVASPLNPQNEPHATRQWSRLLSQPVRPESGEAFGEKGRRMLSPPQIQVGGDDSDETVSNVTENTRSPGTPPPMYTR